MNCHKQHSQIVYENTNWKDLRIWNDNQYSAFKAGVKAEDVIQIDKWTQNKIIEYKLGIGIKDIIKGFKTRTLKEKKSNSVNDIKV